MVVKRLEAKSVSKVRKTSFVKYFNKTPRGIYCPHFWVLVHGQKCPFQCSYCFLNGTYREMAPKPVIYTNVEDMKKNVVKFLSKPGSLVLNSGELCDSLAYDHITELSKWIIPMFANQSNHKLLMLTKSTNIGNIIGLKHNMMTIVSFSINAYKVAEEYESGAPFPIERLMAAKRVQKAYYPLRFRIDPMLPIPGWERKYKQLIEDIKTLKLKPERFTLGTLRYFTATKIFTKKLTGSDKAFQFESKRDGADKRFRILPVIREQMYRTVLGYIKELFPQIDVGLCKETEEMRAKLSYGSQDSKCNCTM